MSELEIILLKKLSLQHLEKIAAAQPNISHTERDKVRFNYEVGFTAAVDLMRGDPSE